MKIDAQDLAETVNKYLAEYGDSIQEDIEKTAKSVAKDVVLHLQRREARPVLRKHRSQRLSPDTDGRRNCRL